jgi:GT2 family glycosyltransferase
MPSDTTSPLLAGVVVHWRNEGELAALIASWPRDPRFELIVVDNSASAELPDWVGAVRPGRNLGFGGGANAGVAASKAPLVLLLNPDVELTGEGLESLVAAFDRFPDAAGIAPRLVEPGGAAQTEWQIRRLPAPLELLAQAFSGLGSVRTAEAPAAGDRVEQPAAAALALRKTAFAAVNGFDPAFHPAWFEDVDLAARLRAAGLALRYWPEATFVHRLGSSVPQLGYGPFLFIYYRNLVRYLAKHHGSAWAIAAYPAILLGALVRLAGLPLRRPGRAASRLDALRGLVALGSGALSGWRLPRGLARISR